MKSCARLARPIINTDSDLEGPTKHGLCMNIHLLSNQTTKASVHRGPFRKTIFRLRYTLGTSSSSWRNTTSAFLCQQTIVTPTSSHSKSLCTFENTRNHKIMIICEAHFCSWYRFTITIALKIFLWNGAQGRLRGNQVWTVYEYPRPVYIQNQTTKASEHKFGNRGYDDVYGSIYQDGQRAEDMSQIV